MKILHFSNWALRKSGLYEAVKEMIKYERKAGIDAQMAILDIENPTIEHEDEGFTPVGWDWAKQADMFVVHRGLPAKVVEGAETKDTKYITIIHGTAEHLVLTDITSSGNENSFNTHINFMNMGRMAVAVNKHDFEIYQNYIRIPGKLVLIDDAVDTDRYNLKGYAHPFARHPQIIFCDSIRNNKNPANIIWAMPEIRKTEPTARLSLFSLPLLSILNWRNMLLRSAVDLIGCTELLQLQAMELRPYYKGADILINGNLSGIPSRVELEAMACGCQVISLSGDWTKYHMKSLDVSDIAEAVIACWNDIKDRQPEARHEAREYILDNHSMEKKVNKEFIPLYNKVLEGK